MMVWQPTMRVWAGDAVKIDEKELEGGDVMEGIEETTVTKTVSGSGSASRSGRGDSLRSQSMSISATASVEAEEEDR